MNMVVILIPLLLLSVVFVSVSVINVNAPTFNISPHSDKTEVEEKVTVTVSVANDGFYISTNKGTLPPIAGCADGPTICLDDTSRDLAAEFSAARAMLERGERELGQRRLDDAVDAYDWRRLYNTLAEIKRSENTTNIVNVAAEPHIPHAAVVRLFDVARHKLARDHYDDVASFWRADVNREDPALFPDPILTVVQ